MKILRLATTINSTSAPYNQFSLGLKDNLNQTFCSLFDSEISISKEIISLSANGSLFKMFKLLRVHLNNNKYDVIHIHSGLTGIIFIFAIFPFKFSLLKRTLFTLHNSWPVLRLRNQFLNFLVMLAAYKICTCGTSSRKSIPRFIDLFVRKKTKAIANGFDDQRIDFIKDSKPEEIHFKSKSKIKIVCVGALNDTKNQISLLESLKDTQIECEVIFLGDGKKKESLVNVTGNRFNLATGTVATTGTAVINVTGKQTNFAIGNATVSGDSLVSVTGNRLNISTGNATVIANAIAAVTGSRVNVATGSVAITGDALINASGNRSNLTIGNATASGGTVITPSGSRINVSTGTVTVTSDAVVSVTGNRFNVAIGNVAITGDALVNVTGNRTNIATGTVTVTANAVVSPDGSQIEIATGEAYVRAWSNLDPNANQTWTTLNTGATSSWTGVNTGATSTWTEIDPTALPPKP